MIVSVDIVTAMTHSRANQTTALELLTAAYNILRCNATRLPAVPNAHEWKLVILSTTRLCGDTSPERSLRGELL